MTVTDQDIEHYADVDLYGVLHLTAAASAELIDRAYRVRMHDVHPDRAGAASTDLAALVNAAGAILRQPEARAHYDALRTAWRAKHEGREAPPSSVACTYSRSSWRWLDRISSRARPS
jgi:DnaJ-class molecular chaperone